ncbi:MAG: BACON domain-containing protein [Bacteroidaceae bacterium]
MKLRHIFGMCLAALMATACSENEVIGLMDEVKLSSSFVAIPAEGGQATFTVEAKGDWKIDDIVTKITTNKDGSVDTTWSQMPSWLTVTPTQGTAGKTTVTLQADRTDYGRQTELHILCGSKVQYINVRQGSLEAASATCAEVNAGADGKTYRVKGTVTQIANTTYGNWYMEDKTGSVYIYGTLDAEGKTKNFTSLGIEVGDVVTVEGPKKTYNGTVELVDVTVLSIEKWMAKLIGEDITQPKSGGTFDVKIAYKGKGCMVSIPEEAREWISYSSMDYVPGIPSKLEQNPADTAVVHFTCAENAGEARVTTLKFVSEKYDAAKETTISTTVSVKVSQDGGIREVTCAEFLALEDNGPQVRITGVISKVANTTYGNIYVRDATGEVYVYGVLTPDGESKKFDTLGLTEGCVVTLQGVKSSYKGSPQMSNGTYVSHIGVKTVSLAEFRNLPDDKSTYYYISGTVAQPTEENTKYDLNTYGNFALTDGESELYIYGCSTGWNGETKKFGTLGVNEGDLLKVLAYKTSYKGLVEGVAIYVSHSTPAE